MSELGISDQGTCIVPVAREALPPLADALSLGRVQLVRKAEHHFTVFGYPMGKLWRKAFSAQPGLRDLLDACIKTHEWSFRASKDRVFHLVQREPALETLILGIEAPIADLFAKARALVAPEALSPELARALEEPPPPHVTLYTTDPAGQRGIGLRTVRDLADAIARAAGAVSEGLQAFALHPGVVLAPGDVAGPP